MSCFLSALGIDVAGRHRDPLYATAWTTIRSAADASAASPLTGRDAVAPLSGWGHAYYCPEHGNPLSFDERQPHRHRCAPFDHDLVGPEYDAGWATARNAMLQTHLASSALAAAVGGDDRDAERAVGILTGLAEIYLDLPLHGDKVGQGRLYAQSLEEAMVATSLTRSYELVAESMTAAQQELVRERLFRPMVAVVREQLLDRTHNIEVWHLAGLASLAVVLDDSELGRFTLDSPNGIRSQLAHGMRSDGWWLEGNPAYHFFMITALLSAVEAHRALGIGDDVGAVVDQLLLAPLRTSRNDLTVPAFNDGWLAPAVPPGLAIYAGSFYRGAHLSATDEVDRFLDSPQAEPFDTATSDFLVYGRRAATGRAPVALNRLDVLPDSGYAVLRQPAAQTGSGPDTCVFLKYGPHGGGHGHPDKLEIELMVDGSRVIADPGSEAYTIPIHDTWYRQTWSHPTVVVDQTSQPPATGVLLGDRQVGPDRFGCVDAQVTFGAGQTDQGVAVLRERVDPASAAAYDGVTIRRMLVMTPPGAGDYLLDLVAVGAGRAQTIDLVTHVRGELTSDAGVPAPSLVTMPHFDRVRQTEQQSGRADYRLTDGGRRWVRVHTGAEVVLTASTPSNPVHQTCATTIQRVHGTHALFASVMPLSADVDVWTSASLLEVAPGTLELQLPGRTHRWTLHGFTAHPGAERWQDPPAQVAAHTLDR